MDMSQMIYGNSVTERAGRDAQLGQRHLPGRRSTGGIGGSNSMSSTGHRIRAAAVAARAELLRLASTKLGVPVASLSVSKGVVSGGGKSVTYGELIGGKLLQRHDARRRDAAARRGARRSRSASTSSSGRRRPRVDIPEKVTGNYTYVHHVRLPGMLHGRWVRPGQGPYG